MFQSSICSFPLFCLSNQMNNITNSSLSPQLGINRFIFCFTYIHHYHNHFTKFHAHGWLHSIRLQDHWSRNNYESLQLINVMGYRRICVHGHSSQGIQMEMNSTVSLSLPLQVFLQHLPSLSQLHNFPDLWMGVLDFMNKFIHLENSDLLVSCL